MSERDQLVATVSRCTGDGDEQRDAEGEAELPGHIAQFGSGMRVKHAARRRVHGHALAKRRRHRCAAHQSIIFEQDQQDG
jgi:hypothetical protein